MIHTDLELIEGMIKNTEATPKNRAACGHLKRVIIRFLFLFTHLYLAVVHFLIIDEGRQFFDDEAVGRRGRLKKNKVEMLFPELRGNYED